MLSDRPYLRNEYPRERTPFLVWLLSATLAGFVVQQLCSRLLHHSDFERLVSLSPTVFTQGNLWAIITYPLVHRDMLHVLAVSLPLFFVGRELVPQVGERRLAGLTLGAVGASGLAWIGVNFGHGGELFGATSILWCYVAMYACLAPNKEISFLVFFVLPVTLRPKHIAWALLVFDSAGLVFLEIPRTYLPGVNLPHSAHLMAMLVGWFAARHLKRIHRSDRETRHASSGAGLREAIVPAVSVAGLTAESQPGANRDDIRAEVDRILDKINSQGFGSLSRDEKRLLDEARDLLTRGTRS